MAIGDQDDFVRRLRSALPLRWFADDAPVLNGVLAGFASVWAILWQNLQFVRAQTRIASAAGEWLDAAAADFFGSRIVRTPGQDDAGFRARILAELFRPRGTRQSLISMLQDLSGSTPSLFEMVDVRDTGGWGGQGAAAGLFYGNGQAASARSGGGGGYGNIGRVLQATAHIPNVRSGLSAGDLGAGAAGVMPCAGTAWIAVET